MARWVLQAHGRALGRPWEGLSCSLSFYKSHLRLWSALSCPGQATSRPRRRSGLLEIGAVVGTGSLRSLRPLHTVGASPALRGGSGLCSLTRSNNLPLNILV